MKLDREINVPAVVLGISASRIDRTLMIHRNNTDLRKLDVTADGAFKLAESLSIKGSFLLSCQVADDGSFQLLDDGCVVPLETGHVLGNRGLRGVVNHYLAYNQIDKDSDGIVKALVSGQAVSLKVIRDQGDSTVELPS